MALPAALSWSAAKASANRRVQAARVAAAEQAERPGPAAEAKRIQVRPPAPDAARAAAAPKPSGPRRGSSSSGRAEGVQPARIERKRRAGACPPPHVNRAQYPTELKRNG